MLLSRLTRKDEFEIDAGGGYGPQQRVGGQQYHMGPIIGPRSRGADALNLSASQLQHLSANGALQQRPQQYGQQVCSLCHISTLPLKRLAVSGAAAADAAKQFG